MTGPSPRGLPPRLVPARLRQGSHVRVIAPARSLAIIGEDSRRIADGRFDDLGLRVSFGRHVNEIDAFASSSTAHRLEDLHEAFEDATVDAIMTVIGGYSSNELLPSIDWELVAANPKILCGYSDITALQLAILTRTGLVTYSGPHYSTFGMERHLDQTLGWFRSCLFTSEPFDVGPSATWSDDLWFLDQQDRRIEANPGWWNIQRGEANGLLLGGNLATMSLLFGTGLLPDLSDTILWLEDDLEASPWIFRRHLWALVQQPSFQNVKGLVIGRFQRASQMTESLISEIIESLGLGHIPVLANVDVGHTDPLATLPVGGEAELVVDDHRSAFRVTMH